MTKLNRKYFRFGRNYWIGRAHEFLNPLWGFFFWLLRIPNATPPSTWRRGVLVGANHIGDVLCLTSTFPVLQEILPGCRWEIYLPPPADQVLRGNPYIHDVYPVQHRRTILDLLLKVRPLMSEKKYDVILCYGQNELWMDLLLAISLRIPNRIGYAHKGFAKWLTFPVGAPEPQFQPFASYFRNLVSQVGSRLEIPKVCVNRTIGNLKLTPQVFPSKDDEKSAILSWNHLNIPKEQPVLLCFLQSRQIFGVWPSWHILKTVQELSTRGDYVFIFSGSEKDINELEKFQESFSSPSFIFTGGILETACLMKKCRAVISTDSGPRHLANAMDVPVFFMRNIWFPAQEARAYCPNEIDLSGRHQLVGPKDAHNVWMEYNPRDLARTISSHLGQMEPCAKIEDAPSGPNP